MTSVHPAALRACGGPFGTCQVRAFNGNLTAIALSPGTDPFPHEWVAQTLLFMSASLRRVR